MQQAGRCQCQAPTETKSNMIGIPSADKELTVQQISEVMGLSAENVSRLFTRGRVGVSGAIVRLDRWRSSRGWVSSMEAIELFRIRLNDPLYVGSEAGPLKIASTHAQSVKSVEQSQSQ